MKDVYTTDHVKKTKQFNTLSEEEDKQFYDYLESIKEYSTAARAKVNRFESGKYERGSLKQRIFEPLAGAQVLENGTRMFEFTDKDLRIPMCDFDDDQLRAEYEQVKNLNAVDIDNEDQDALRI